MIMKPSQANSKSGTVSWWARLFLHKALAAIALVMVLALLLTTARSEGGEELDLKALFHDNIPESPFVDVVYGYADAMLAHGRDNQGAGKSGLFLGALDRKTLLPLSDRPTEPLRANPQLDQNLLRLLYFLRGLSGEDRYPRAADRALEWFLKHTASPTTGLFPWGERAGWDVVRGEPAARSTIGLAHEFHRPWMLWARCFELAPEESKRFALGLWQGHFADQNNGALDPRVDLHKPAPRGGLNSPRHMGFFIRTWAEAYAQSGDPVFLTAIGAVMGSHERERDGGKLGPPLASSLLSLAIDVDGASRMVPASLRGRLRAAAARVDKLFCSLRHPLVSKSGFTVSSLSIPVEETAMTTPLWGVGTSKNTTAHVAMMCVSRYQNTGQIAYRRLLVAAADAYLDSLPGEDVDAWPVTFGQAISLELAAYRVTANRRYFSRAFQLGEIAVERFFDDSPLPRASLHTEHYENTTGADTLVLALAELHLLTRTITVVRTPANTIDR